MNTNTTTPPPRLVPDRPSDAEYVLVPSVPTPEMLRAGIEAQHKLDGEDGFMKWADDIYAAMLAAAPPAEAHAERGDGMLPDALVPFATEWYTFCERAPHAERIKVSGELAEAIVQTVVAPAAAPAAPAEGDGDDDGSHDVAVWTLVELAEACGAKRDSDDNETWWTLDLHAFYALEAALYARNVPWQHNLSTPRVTGGREADEAAAERAARFICATCGEDWDSIGDFARGVLIENQRGALQAANGGASNG